MVSLRMPCCWFPRIALWLAQAVSGISTVASVVFHRGTIQFNNTAYPGGVGRGGGSRVRDEARDGHGDNGSGTGSMPRQWQ